MEKEEYINNNIKISENNSKIDKCNFVIKFYGASSYAFGTLSVCSLASSTAFGADAMVAPGVAFGVFTLASLGIAYGSVKKKDELTKQNKVIADKMMSHETTNKTLIKKQFENIRKKSR